MEIKRSSMVISPNVKFPISPVTEIPCRVKSRVASALV